MTELTQIEPQKDIEIKHPEDQSFKEITDLNSSSIKTDHIFNDFKDTIPASNEIENIESTENESIDDEWGDVDQLDEQIESSDESLNARKSDRESINLEEKTIIDESSSSPVLKETALFEAGAKFVNLEAVHSQIENTQKELNEKEKELKSEEHKETQLTEKLAVLKEQLAIDQNNVAEDLDACKNHLNQAAPGLGNKFSQKIKDSKISSENEKKEIIQDIFIEVDRKLDESFNAGKIKGADGHVLSPSEFQDYKIQNKKLLLKAIDSQIKALDSQTAVNATQAQLEKCREKITHLKENIATLNNQLTVLQQQKERLQTEAKQKEKAEGSHNRHDNSQVKRPMTESLTDRFAISAFVKTEGMRKQWMRTAREAEATMQSKIIAAIKQDREFIQSLDKADQIKRRCWEKMDIKQEAIKHEFKGKELKKTETQVMHINVFSSRLINGKVVKVEGTAPKFSNSMQNIKLYNTNDGSIAQKLTDNKFSVLAFNRGANAVNMLGNRV